MLRVTLVLSCLTVTAHGRRVQLSGEPPRRTPFADSRLANSTNPTADRHEGGSSTPRILEGLAKVLVAFKPPVRGMLHSSTKPDSIATKSARWNVANYRPRFDPVMTMKVDYSIGEKVKIEILRFTPLGAACRILDDEEEPETLLIGKELAWFEDAHRTQLVIGDRLFAYVAKVRDDDKRVDLTLREVGSNRAEVVQNLVMDALEASPTLSLPVGDKSSSESIDDCLPGVTKREFKYAVGSLYKQGWVIPGASEIRLSTIEEENKLKRAAKVKAAESEMEEEEDEQLGRSGDGNFRYGIGAGKKIKRLNPTQKNKNVQLGSLVVLRNIADAVDEDLLEETVLKVMDPEKILSIQLTDRFGERIGYLELPFRHVADAVEALEGVECMGRPLMADFDERERQIGVALQKHRATGKFIGGGKEEKKAFYKALAAKGRGGQRSEGRYTGGGSQEEAMSPRFSGGRGWN